MDLYKMDQMRYVGNDNGVLKFLKAYRKLEETSNFFVKAVCKIKIKCFEKKHMIEIPYNIKIGGGLYIGHPYCITINPKTIIGKNVNIHKGVTIGQENRGKRKGTPIIGNDVWIGVNSTVVGAINIGDDVMIAPNTFVNCDVPSHSIVIGNPCMIKHKEYATEGYIENKCP